MDDALTLSSLVCILCSCLSCISSLYILMAFKECGVMSSASNACMDKYRFWK